MKSFQIIRSKLKNIHKKVLYIVSAVVLGISTSLSIMLSLPASATPTFTTFSAPSGYSNLGHIASAGGSLWYIENGPGTSSSNTYIGKMTTLGATTNYNVSTLSGISGLRPYSLTKGSDGNIWFNAYANNAAYTGVLNISTGLITTYSSTVSTYGSIGPIVAAADGSLRYAVKYNGLPSYTYLIKVVPSTGATTTTVLSTNDYASATVSATSGPDGAVWVTDDYIYNNKVYGVNIGLGGGGNYTIPNAGTYNRPGDIATGSDGNLWLGTTGGKILKLATGGVFTEYIAPMGQARNFITGSNNIAVWFSDGGKIGRITSSGTITEYTAPGAATSMVFGPDGAIWFTYYDNGSSLWKVGRMDISPTNQTISFTSTAPTNALVDGATYTPTVSATSGLPVALTVDSSSTGVCTLTSGVVSFQGAGTCTLNANQGGDADYSPAPQVQQSFTVVPVRADSSVALSCPTSVSVGSTVTCTITASNDGPAAAQNAILTAVFPNSLSSPTVSGGGTISGQTINWSSSSFAASSSNTLTFSATASTGGKLYLSTSLLQANPDSDTSNNTDYATVLVN